MDCMALYLKNSAMTQTLNLQNLISRLLCQHPDLSAWMQVCEVYIDRIGGTSATHLESDFSTKLAIECRFPAVANLFAKNILRLLTSLTAGIPMPIHIKLQSELIVAYHPLPRLQLKSTIRGFTMLASTIDTQAPQKTKEHTIDLTQIPSPMQEMVREQVAFLGLPVYLKPDGGYQLPATSFDIAWQEIGNGFKRGEEFNISLPPETTNGRSGNLQESAPNSISKPKKDSISPRATLMRNKLTDEDIQLGRGSNISKTIANFMAKVNLKNHTREEILNGIAQRTDYGTQLLTKLYEAYCKKDKLYKVKFEEWTKLEAKIVEECGKLLVAPPLPEAEAEPIPEEEATETTD